jgi:hypothetical protein
VGGFGDVSLCLAPNDSMNVTEELRKMGGAAVVAYFKVGG